MERKLYSFLIVLFILFSSNICLAAEEAAEVVAASPTTSWQQRWLQRAEGAKEKVEQRNQEGNEVREQRKEKIEERRAKIKANITEKVRKRIKNITNRIKSQLQKRINRLEKIAARIQDRFSFFKEKGRDTTEAETKLTEARTAIVRAQTDLNAVEPKLNELLEDENPRSILPELKEAVKKVRKDLALARQALAKTVNLLVRPSQN